MENVTISTSSYKDDIRMGKEFYIQFKHWIPDVEAMLAKCTHRILSKYDLLYYKETISSILKELINNSIKANMKRLYFRMRGLDIAKTEDYRMGMETFKEDTYENSSDEYFRKLVESDYMVRVIFKPIDDSYVFYVVNNTPILDLELYKIDARIKRAYAYPTMAEVFDDMLDDSEGAGLGLIMSVMMMKNSGMPMDALRVWKKNNMTISAVKVSYAAERSKRTTAITEEILNEIKAIPAFPENIRQIEMMCCNPEVDMREISTVISCDPGLTAMIMKLVNSAGYYVPKVVMSIDEAVKIVGINGIRTLLIATGAQKVLSSRYKKYEAVWETSYKRASYAQKIAIQLKMNRIGDAAYLAGLLSDVGRKILLSVNPETINKLKVSTGIDGIADSTVIEEISLGVSHTHLGGMVCSKWGFDKALISAIELHHAPHLSGNQLKPLIYSVYLADVLIDIENKKTHHRMVDEDVLEFMKLGDAKDFENFHRILSQSYAAQSRPARA